MKKSLTRQNLTYGLGLLAAMGAAIACRVWQRGAAFEDSGLLTPNHPATWCLLAVLALAAVGFFLASRWMVPKAGGPGSYLQAFALPQGWLGAGAVAADVVAGALLVAAGVVDLWQRVPALYQAIRQAMDAKESVWSAILEVGLSQTVLAVLLLPAGVAMGLVGFLGTSGQEGKGRFAWPLLLPAYGGCVWLIAFYQANATDPNAFGYAVSLLGAVCAVLCSYTVAAFSFEKPMARWTLWLCGMAATGLASYFTDCCLDGLRIEGLVCLGYLLYVLVQGKVLALRCQRPATLEPWTPDDVETEVTEDE